ncbi:MAG TPA: aldehyde:ferredoxin oxidoreductase [Candidatus Bathyarchaeota archaeon]|nr:aldehyde:ferredoxin oxidoreductase [Candidatus Bathyarchaeota archaeon]
MFWEVLWMPVAYNGRLLEVDLSRGRTTVRRLEEGFLRRYIGGKGFAARILYDELGAGVDPLGEDNVLLIAVGPVQGLRLSGASRFSAFFKSPLTGIWGESCCGGSFGPELKRTGFDGVIIRGKSDRPVYLLIEDEHVEIRDAGEYWGVDALESEKMLKQEHSLRHQVLTIGPAGERLVKFACISHAGGRQLGRCGAGAVMGSKKLKAVVVRGTGEVEAANPEGLSEFKEWLEKEILERVYGLRKYGTPGIIVLCNRNGALPTRNWTAGEFEGLDKIEPKVLRERYMKEDRACYACVLACGKLSVVESGPYAGARVEGPEYETLFALGPLCGVDNPEAIIKANEVCDRLGLDTITAGNVVAFAMELSERGILSREDVGGLELRFGNYEAMIRLLEMIGRREGIGDVLAEGVREASRRIGRGAEAFAVHVKGLEPPGYDPRNLKGVALAYAVSCRGACHLRHMAYRPNLTGEHPFKPDVEVDRLSYEGHAEIVKEQEDFYTLVDSMIFCKFHCLPTLGPVLWDELCRLYELTTGWEASKAWMTERANEINDLIRAFNLREGITTKDDTLPERLFSHPVRGEVVDRDQLKRMVSEFYRLRGWDEEGRPKLSR